MNLKYLAGWKTQRKIIVFESDDWGSFRFKNKSIRDQYLKDEKSSGWMHYNDCFESYEDLKPLAEVLNSVKDIHNNPACFTFLMNPANPDFDKIKAHNFKTYHYETFLETLSKRQDGKSIKNWYQKALDENLIEIGFHGREHLNVQAWMQDLQSGDQETLGGFTNRIWGQGIIKGVKTKIPHRSTFDIQSREELKELELHIKDGVRLLNDMFHIKTSYFLPPDGPYHLSLNKTLAESGIQYIGLPKLHNNPLEPKFTQKKVFWLGKKTKDNLRVITRNATFEPASPRSNNWVDTALNHIEEAFTYKSPAVISTHRANYTGSLNTENRNKSLEKLKTLLDKILVKWPEVEFMTSSQLGGHIKS